jgi:hypothetical protein
MSASKPTFEGYGTPIVLLFDHLNNPILDLRAGGGGTYDVALESFTYEFKEKEEDKCTIVMSSSILPIMDDVNFFVNQRLKVAWGYLNGDICPPIEIVIVNTKEEFTTKGFALTLELSDSFSVASSQVNPQVLAIQKKLDFYKDFRKSLQQPVQVDRVNPLLFKRVTDALRSGLPKGTTEDDITKLSEHIVEGEVKARTTLQDFRTNWGSLSDDQANLIFDEAKQQQSRHLNLERFTPGVLNAIIEAMGPDPNFEWSQNFLDKGDQIALQPEYGNHFYVVGNNTKTISTNLVNQVSTEPMQVTGRDGKAITYSKRRAHAGPAIKSYTWKQEDGRFLEFTYDSNSKYSNDNSVLAQFTIDPETGAITRRDYIREVRIDVDDTGHPNKFMQMNADTKLADKLNEIQAQGGSTETYLLEAPGSHMAVQPDGRLGGYIYSGIMGQEAPYHFGYRGEEINRGIIPDKNMKLTDLKKPIVQEYQQAMDGIGAAMPGLPIVVVPTMDSPVDEESLQNEMKALKQGDGEQVKATAKVLGDPQLFSGINVDLLGLGRRRSGKYFLTGVIHNIQPSSGFICTLEGYLASSQATGISTVTSTVEKKEIKTKAQDIKKSKIKVSPNYAEIEARGYYLSTDFEQTEMEAEMFKKDKDWATKLPGTIYTVKMTNKAGEKKTFKIKCPVDPVTGTAQYPYKVFGDDIFWKLIGEQEDLRGTTISKTNSDGSTTVTEFTQFKTLR